MKVPSSRNWSEHLLAPWLAVFLVLLATASALRGGGTPVTALVFSPDGVSLVSNGDRELQFRKVPELSLIRSIPCPFAKFGSFAFGQHGRILAVSGGDPGRFGAARLFGVAAGNFLGELGRRGDVVARLAFNAHGDKLATASADGRIEVFRIGEAGEFKSLFSLDGHKGPVHAVAFSPGDRSILSAGADRSLKVWKANDGGLIRTLNYHTEAVFALEILHPAQNSGRTNLVCATAGDDRTVRVWQPEIGRMMRIVRGHEGSILALAAPVGANTIYSAGSEGLIRCIDASSDQILASWKAHDDWIYTLAASPDGKWLASGDWAGRVKLHDLTTHR